MDLTIPVDSLRAAVGATAPSLPRGTPPRGIYQNFLLAAADGRLTVTAANGESASRALVPPREGLDIREDGAALVPAEKFQQVLREGAGESLTLTAGASGTMLRLGLAEWELPSGGDPATFPSPPAWGDSRAHHEIDAAALLLLARRTRPVGDETAGGRYMTRSALWDLGPDRLALVATDGRRLAVAEAPPGACRAVGDVALAHKPLVPTEAMAAIERLLAGAEGPVRVAFSDAEVLLDTGTAQFFGRLAEGRFPRWQDVLPRAVPQVRLRLKAAALMAAVKQARVMTDQESNRVVFRLQGGTLALSAQGPATGRSRVELAVAPDQAPEGPWETSYNPSYVLDFLKQVPADEEALWEAGKPDVPCLWRHGEHYQYVLMPLS